MEMELGSETEEKDCRVQVHAYRRNKCILEMAFLPSDLYIKKNHKLNWGRGESDFDSNGRHGSDVPYRNSYVFLTSNLLS